MSRQARASTGIVLWIVVGVVVCGSTLRAQTISDRIRAARLSDVPLMMIGSVDESGVLTLAELVKASDLVVEASVVHVRTYANDRDTDILTDFAIVPNQVLAGSVPVGVSTPGATAGLMLTTYGGEIVRDGVHVRAIKHGLRPVMEGVRYLLFLKKWTAPGTYQIYNAAAFELSDVAKPLAISGADLFPDVANRPYKELVKEIATVSAPK
jgi:hypothetical protein